MTDKVAIILGSASDEEFIKPMKEMLDYFGITYQIRVSSAHRTPEKVLNTLKKYNGLIITVAGMSNALSGMSDANTPYPVIACPRYSAEYGGVDLYSSLRTPKGVAPLTVIDPANAALATAKILAMNDLELREKILQYQQSMRDEVEEADKKLGGD